MPRFQPSGRSTRAAFSTPSTSNNRIGTSVVADMWGSSQAATEPMRRSRPSIRASNLAGTSSTRGSLAGGCPVPAGGRGRRHRATSSGPADASGRRTGPTHEGGTPEDWELDPVLEEVLGSEGAEKALATFTEFLQEEQTGWSFTPVPLDGA